jgi:hypothetical protein
VQLDFDGMIRWLDDRLGRRVVVGTQGAGEDEMSGNSSLSVRGYLIRQDDGEIALISPAPGRVEVFRVGEAGLILLEGDFHEAATADGPEGLPVMVQARFQNLLITIAEVTA